MASAPSVILWVGVHGQTAAWGTACRMRDEEPVLIAGLIKVSISSSWDIISHTMPGISQTSGIFLVKDQARFRRWFAWLVTLCLFPHIINSKTKWKRCRNLHIVTKWKCSWSLGWVPVFCTDLGDNDPPLAPEQPDNTLSLGNMGRGLLPDPGIQSVYPIVWESHTSASLKRRWRAKSQILVTMEMYFPWGNITSFCCWPYCQIEESYMGTNNWFCF